MIIYAREREAIFICRSTACGPDRKVSSMTGGKALAPSALVASGGSAIVMALNRFLRSFQVHSAFVALGRNSKSGN
jgi:hypothetical protein